MEYPFKDLLPLDEATARTGYYKDWTHIDANTFHQISELVKFIREKGYGVDTREAIAQALERVYHDAMKSGNADMELSMARKHFKDLASRLDSSDFDMRNINVNWINKNLGKLDQTFMTDEFLQQMAGDAPINAVPADGSLTTDKYSDGSVTQAKVSFVDSTGYADTIIKATITGSIGGISLINPNNIARTAVFEIEPDKTYTISKEPSSRFRVATTVDFPEIGSEFNNFYLDEYNQTNEQENTRFSFVSKPGDNYLVVYYSNAGESIQVHLAEGDVPEHDFKKVKMLGDINAPNIVRGKNLFDGKYANGIISGSVKGTGAKVYRGGNVFPNGRTIITRVDKNTNYSIYKTPSNRFRVALSSTYPKELDSIFILKDETVGGGDSATQFTLNTGEYIYLLITVCNNTVDIPDFVQIEKGDKVTELETYGYKFSPEVKPLFEDSSSDVISVESFRSAPLTDRGVVQLAFNSANGKIVSFESGRTYKLDDGLTASATNVRGILGNNAILEINGENKVALTVNGSKTTGGSGPDVNADALIREEGSFFIEKLLVTSKDKFLNDGITVEGLFKPILKDLLIFRCKNGLTFKGRSRDVILDNLNIYDNAETGLLFDNVNIHQLNIHSGHISYGKNVIKFINGDIANVVFSGVSAENNNNGGGYTESESIISFEETAGASAIFEVIIFSGCNIQEHGKNTKPIVNFDVSNGQVHDVIMGDTLLGNCGPSSIPFYGKKIMRLSINNVNTPSNSGLNSFVLEGAMSHVRIMGSSIIKPLNYDNANIDKMIIANNTTMGFTLPDSNDGNILIKDNI